jgi:hypothetical protein
MNCTTDALEWLQERTKVISVSIDARFGLQRVIQNVDSEHRKTSNWRSVHRNGDDDVVSVIEGLKMKSPRGDFKNPIYDSARSHASRCHHLTTKHLIECRPIISPILINHYRYQQSLSL